MLVIETNATTEPTLLFTVEPNTRATVTVNVQGIVDCTARIATTKGGAPSARHWMTPAHPVGPEKAPFGVDRLTLDAGDEVYVEASEANGVGIQIWGIQEVVA